MNAVVSSCVRGGASGRTCVEHGLPLYPSGQCLEGRSIEPSPVQMFAPSDDPKTTSQLTAILAIRKMQKEALALDYEALVRELQAARDRLQVLTLERDELLAMAEEITRTAIVGEEPGSDALVPGALYERLLTLLAELHAAR
jgi:hypothetical protein